MILALLLLDRSSSCILLSIEAGEIESWRSTWAAMLEFSSGSLPPFPPFRGCATDDKDAGGDDEGVPGDPEKKMFEFYNVFVRFTKKSSA